MPVPAGTRFGPYEILGPLGAGGMGEVYRARDTRLDRIVAFKIIAPELADRPGRRQRFHREARAISALSHPNICALFDVGEENDAAFLVMEYLDGETLAARLLRGPLPRDQLLRRANEIASALDHAHRQGVVHRDLKPSNVMITSAGAKLLDFGLAKLRHTGAGVISDTLLMPGAATAEGTILGTIQYMAPEQLEGKDADPRTDVFGFGALVFEMATAQKAFGGDSQASVIAAIMRADSPRISAVDPLTPASLDHVVTRCLAKDPDERWQTTRDLMIELRAIDDRESGGGSGGLARRDLPSDQAVAAERTPARRRRGDRFAWVAALTATLVAIVVGILYLRTRDAAAKLADAIAVSAVRSELPSPPGTSVGAMALSPDGRRLVFVGRSGRTSRLWVRALDAIEAQPITGTDGADYPFWAPDGQALGFFAGSKLKRVDVTGGNVQVLADAPNTRGGTWNQTGTIVFSPNSQTLHQVPSTGGPTREVTRLDAGRAEVSHRWPSFLPDGRHFLYLAQSSVPENRGLFVGSLDNAMATLVVRTEDSGAYAAAAGHLLFLRDKTLMAQRFDATRFEIQGKAVPLAEPVSVNGLERAQFDVSAGALVYRRGGFLGGSELAWFDRTGRRVGNLGAPADYRGVRISPDGRRIAVGIEDQSVGTPDIWVHDVARGGATRFTFDPATDRDPVWSPDGDTLAIRSNRGDQFTVYARGLNGLGGEQLLLQSAINANIHDWSRDGRYIVFTRAGAGGDAGRDLWVLPVSTHSPYSLVGAPRNQSFPRFSPSGRWLAYQTDDSGRNKVFVMPFPDSGDKWEISPDGGIQPLWRADGKELFFQAPDNTIMAVDVREGSKRIEFGTPRPLFQAAITFFVTEQPSWTWDVAPDGQRFLIILIHDDPAPVTLVTSWQADLQR